MTVALICIAAVLVLAVAALAYLASQSRLAPGPALRGHTVEIHTRKPDDQTIRGILVAEHADRITLTEPVYRTATGDHALKDNILHIPTGNIAWFTEIEAE